MPSFAQGLVKDKLFILFAINELSADAPKEFALSTLFYCDLISVFDFSIALSSLEEEGLVLALPRPFGQSYRISDEGRETLRLFGDSLPFSERERVCAYIRENRGNVRHETQVFSEKRELPGGEIELILKVAEGIRVVFSVSLSVSDLSDAKLIRENWETKNADAYAAICEILLQPPEAQG